MPTSTTVPSKLRTHAYHPSTSWRGPKLLQPTASSRAPVASGKMPFRGSISDAAQLFRKGQTPTSWFAPNSRHHNNVHVTRRCVRDPETDDLVSYGTIAKLKTTTKTRKPSGLQNRKQGSGDKNRRTNHVPTYVRYRMATSDAPHPPKE